MHKAPTKLKILGKTFEVSYVKPCGLSCEADGIVRHSDQVIKANRECNHERQKEVILHELVHAIDRIIVLNLGEDNTIRLSNALYAVLRKNPKLVKWIMEKKA